MRISRRPHAACEPDRLPSTTQPPTENRTGRRARGFAVASLALAAALTASACGSSAQADDDGRIAVVSSTAVWGDIAEQVGGDAVNVTTIVPDGADPHDFQVSPTDALEVSDAQLLITNGGGYDGFFQPLVDGSGSSADIVDAFSLSDTDRGLGPVRAADDDNEHVWFDLNTVDAVAATVADRLAELDPDGAADFHANADALHAKLQELAQQADEIAAAGPGPVVSTEPVAHYLLERAGIADETPPDFGEAVEQGSDPAPATLAELRTLLAGDTISALVYNTQTDSPTTESVRSSAEQAQIPVVEFAESPPDGTSYTDWVHGLLDSLRGATTQ